MSEAADQVEKKTWIEATIHVQALDSETVESGLEDLGAVAITYSDAADQPIFEPPLGTTPLWDNTLVTGLFTDDFDSGAIEAALTGMLELQPGQLKMSVLEDQPWERSWLDHFEPLQFGERLWIVPSAYEPPNPDAVNILLDPGLAFGTGTHPTTALCLKWLDKNADRIKGHSVIDYGCGSGILAIAAALLGASNILGTDIDPQALEATRDNAERNAVTDAITLELVPENDTKAPPAADILLANILAGPLQQLAPKLTPLSKGPIVLSGILAEQLDAVSVAYQAEGCVEVQRRTSGDWGLLEFAVSENS